MTNLRRRADGEGVPLVSSDGEDVDEDPVADVKVELGLANPPPCLSRWREALC